MAQLTLVLWLGIAPSKYYDWKKRYGRATEHNGSMPRDFCLEEWEREAIVDYHDRYPLEGYRRLTYMMMDDDVVAVSPSTTYRVLKVADRIGRPRGRPSSKGKGFVQPSRPHEHWHIDISYLNICGTFYYLCSILDGYSRGIVHREIREQMKEADVEIIIQLACPPGPDPGRMRVQRPEREEGLGNEETAYPRTDRGEAA